MPSKQANYISRPDDLKFMARLELTAIIRKGEKQYVALCPELDVVSQGRTIESALANLREAAELYIEEMGVPKEFSPGETIFAQFEVKTDAKASSPVGA